MHTDPTLDILSLVTTSLGNRFRTFRDKTCAAFPTKELERERVARARRQEKSKAKTTSGSSKSQSQNLGTGGRKPKILNLKTYKYHALGDYASTIRQFGTTDSYSTQPVSFFVCPGVIYSISRKQSEREHRTSKGRFLRTSGRSISQQLSKIERRQHRVRMIRETLNGPFPQVEPDDPPNDPRSQYSMGTSQNFPVHIPTFLQKNEGDPAVKVNAISTQIAPVLTHIQNFVLKLREHLLPRIRRALQQEAATLQNSSTVPVSFETNPGPVFSFSVDRSAVDFIFFKNDCIYHHKLLRFHFTTYDVRRGMDVVNAGTSRHNIMLLAEDECENADGSTSSNSHPFLYARVLGAYHANVLYTGPGMRNHEPRCFDFLWVRWYELVNSASSGWSSSKLDTIRFPPMHQANSFGFVDPKDVLRACHIIPAFAKGKRHTNEVGISRCAKDRHDYIQYYIGQ